ncbi:hypothetical protein L209DRAFT_759036 [Thermothelomyces heterothallicus CBS 203.75]
MQRPRGSTCAAGLPVLCVQTGRGGPSDDIPSAHTRDTEGKPTAGGQLAASAEFQALARFRHLSQTLYTFLRRVPDV